MSLIGGVTVSLSGCLSEDSSSETTSGVDGGSVISEAEADIGYATEHIAEEASFEFARQPSVSIRTGTISLALNDADVALDRSSKSDSSVTKEETQVYQDYVQALRTWTDSLESAEEALDTLSAAEAYRKTERYKDAIKETVSARDMFINVSETAVSAREKFNQINFDMIGPESVDYKEMKEVNKSFVELVSAYKRYTTATIPYYRGLESYWGAVEASGNGQYSAVNADLNDASNQFELAKSRYQDAEQAVSASARSVFIKQTCLADAMYESSEFLIKASFERQDNNAEQAREYVDQAVAARKELCQV